MAGTDTDRFARFSLVERKSDRAIGRVLRTDHYGVFVLWDGGKTVASYAREDELDAVQTGYVDELLAIIRWLHPDRVPDPITMDRARRELGDHVAVLFNDIVLTNKDGFLPHNPTYRTGEYEFDDDTD